MLQAIDSVFVCCQQLPVRTYILVEIGSRTAAARCCEAPSTWKIACTSAEGFRRDWPHEGHTKHTCSALTAVTPVPNTVFHWVKKEHLSSAHTERSGRKNSKDYALLFP